MTDNTLIIVPARKGSKGIPDKNIKLLNGVPLIEYTLDFAKKIKGINDKICVTTDSDEIIEISNKAKIKVHFKRPDYLSGDNVEMNKVIEHAINFYKKDRFKYVLLLQPTSPLREVFQFNEIRHLLESDPNTEVIISVKKAKDNPFFNEFIEDESGYLNKMINEKSFTIRQKNKVVYAVNGSYYFFKTSSFLKNKKIEYRKAKKFLMEDFYSFDIDCMLDFEIVELLIKNKCRQKG